MPRIGVLMKTILVVDDEPKIVALARDYLEHAGFGVLTAADGASALETVRRRHPDLESRLGVRHRPFDDLIAKADVVTLHAPLTPDTRHLIDAGALERARRGVETRVARAKIGA